MNKITDINLNQPSLNNKIIQFLLNWIAFFIAFPVLDVLGNSIYFYFLVILLFYTLKVKGTLFRLNLFSLTLFLLFIIGLISSIFHPELGRHVSFFSKFMSVFKYGYWFCISIYFVTWFKEINFYLLSKYISIGLVLHILTFYFLPIKFDLILVSFSTIVNRNSLVFNVITFSGFLAYYLYIKHGSKSVFWGSMFILFSMLFSGGRAGSILGVLLLFLNTSLLSKTINLGLKSFVLVFMFVYMFFTANNETIYNLTSPFATYFEKINPRVANLLQGNEDGDLTNDKSWLLRELMVDKTFEILGNYPFIGVGWGNFSNYYANLDEMNYKEYERLSHQNNEYLNTRSAHNSYASFAAETGILGFVLLLIILVPLTFFTIYNYIFNNNMKIMFFVSISFIGMLIHMYAITAITGTNFWFILGIVEGIRNYKSRI
jgi:hypothetical protein